MVSEASMNVELGRVPDHGMKKVNKIVLIKGKQVAP